MKEPRQLHAGREPGFTLIELTLIILILGVIAGVVGPRFFNNSDYTASFFEQNFLSAARYAHDIAVTGGCHVQMNITAGSYTLNTDANCLTGPTPPVFTAPVMDPGTLNAAATMQGTAPTGVSINGFAGNLIFAPDGTLRTPNWNSNPFNTLAITISATTSQTITFSGISGYIR